MRTTITWWACALALSGCGVWLEGGPAQVSIGGGVHASATARVEMRAGASSTIAVAEQPAGAGFILEDGASSGGIESEGWGASSGGGTLVVGPGARADLAIAGGGGAVGVGTVASNVATGGAALGGAPTQEIGIATRDSGIAISGTGPLATDAGGIASGGSGAAGSGAPGSPGNTATVVANVDGAGAGGAGAGGGASGVPGAAGSASGGAGRDTSLVTGSSASGALAGVDPALGGGAALDVEAAASVPRSGVHGVDGRPARLTALLGAGVQVDGVRVRLAPRDSLEDVTLPSPASARLATDEAVEAWAELEHDQLPRAGGETHVVLRVRGGTGASVPRARLRVHLVLDRSSSMQRSWQQVLAAARLLIGRLDAQDEIHIVAYGTDAIEAFPLGRVGDGRAAARALDGISVGGGTNIEAGLELAYRAGDGARSLVILLSDGVPNHGAFEPAELGALAARARNEHGCTTSVIGLGTEFDARLLRAIAMEGRGGYHVSAGLDRLASGLVAEIDRHARLAARGLQARIELPAGVTLVDAGASGAQVQGSSVVLALPRLDAGEERSLVLRVRVEASRPPRLVARASLSYRSAISGTPIAAARDLQLSFGPRAVLAGAGLGVLDASLAAALDQAGDAILDGRGETAARALRAHVGDVEGRVEASQSPLLAARSRVVSRLATAVETLTPAASHGERRSVALALGSLAVSFGR